MINKATILSFKKITDPTGAKILELSFNFLLEDKQSLGKDRKVSINLKGDPLDKTIAEFGSDNAGILNIIKESIKENFLAWSGERGITQAIIQADTKEDITRELGTDTITSL